MERKNPLSAFLEFIFSLFEAFFIKKADAGSLVVASVIPDQSQMRKWGLVFAALFSFSMFSWGQSAGDYRSVSTGSWDVITTWETYDGASWVPCAAGDYPGALGVAGVVNIRNGHTITLNVNPVNAIGDLSFQASTTNNTTLSMSGQTLTVTGSVTFGVPSVNFTRQSLILGSGTLNCASISNPPEQLPVG